MAATNELHKEWSDEQMIGYIQKRPCWTSKTPAMEKLVGGLINRNWVVSDGDRKFVARAFFDAEDMGINEASVHASTRAASAVGVTPTLRYAEPHLTVVDFIDGRNLREDELSDETIVAKCMERVRVLHTGLREIQSPINYHWRPVINRNLCNWSIAHKSPHADAMARYLPVLDRLEKAFRPFYPTLTHNDLAHVNVMIDKRQTIWLIDWDFGAVGHWAVDLTDLISYAPVSEELNIHALKSYLGEKADSEEFDLSMHEYRASMMLSYIFQAAWAAISDFNSHLSAESVADSMNAYFSADEASYVGFMKKSMSRFDLYWQRYGDRF